VALSRQTVEAPRSVADWNKEPIFVMLDEFQHVRWRSPLERFQKTFGYVSKSEMVRDTLRNFMIELRKTQLQANLKRYFDS